MKLLIKILIVSLIISLFNIDSIKGKVRYHCPNDSAGVMQLISKARGEESYGKRIVAVAKALEETPYGKAADNDSLGTIIVRLDSLNQRELIYISLAVAKTAGFSLPSLKEFEKNLESISRKKGKDEGFVSQFLYGSDWIVDNVYRGNLQEMTEYLENGNYRTKTLDYVSRHPDEFPAMRDSLTREKVKLMEFGYRSHRIPHLKKQSIGNKNLKELLRNGDLIIMCPLEDDFDIYDIGIVSLETGEPTLIHIPKEIGVVTIDPFPIDRRFKVDGQYFYGFRWLRPRE